ncbi:ABC transporter ATP-binding protein [Euzebya sp.]|uniref:ABC transporter ATP-binding protein n=1 Tax=Euzebya sp. TaxID=1971409 RepID=UPI0035189DBE
MSGLHLDVGVHLGTLELTVDLAVAAGEVVAVVGPNGAGKSTLLRVVAGLLAPDRGRVRLAGRDVVDVAAGVDVPSADRHVGVVFQDLLLFDHLSALENVAFGPRSRGLDRAAAATRAAAWLERVGLQGLGGAPPATLSGGQRQRVALARALAADPDCLLLDEPLSALDADARGAVRRELRTHLAAFDGPVLVVTHEPLEALALADRLVVLEGGRVTQSGSPAEVARRPRSDWVARLVGINLFPGTAGAGHVVVDGGGRLVVPGPLPTGPLLVTVHPRSVSLHREPPSGSPRNVWAGEVGDVEIAGDRVRVQVRSRPPVVAAVTAAALADLDLAAGGAVWASFKAADVEVYPR